MKKKLQLLFAQKKWWIPAIAAAAAVIAVVLLLILWPEKAPDTPEEVPLVGVCMSDLANPQEEACAKQVKELLLQKGFQVALLDAKEDQSQQNQQVTDLLSRDCSGLVISPVMPDAVAQLVQSADSKQVPVVFFTREPAKEIMDLSNRVSFVGFSPAQKGEAQGNLALQLPQSADANGDGTVSYIALRDQEECADSVLQTDSAVKALCAGTQVFELTRSCVGTTQEAAREVFAELLASYGPDVELILCTDDTIALGALQAIKDGGRTVGERIFLIGAGGSDKALEKISLGEMSGTVLCDTDAQAAKIVELLEQMQQGNTVGKWNYVNYKVVTKETVGQYQK